LRTTLQKSNRLKRVNGVFLKINQSNDFHVN